METTQKSAFLAIVGCPNVGKSSLLNAILGQKIAIVSSKPQTTRTRIMGIFTQEETQLVFLDTPGLHKARNRLDDYMDKSISASISGVDGCVLVIEPDSDVQEGEIDLIERIKRNGLPVVLVINKIDKIIDKTKIMEQIEKYSALCDFDAIVPISAVKGDGVPSLINQLKKLANEGMHFFEEDEITDQPERVIAGEIVREKLLRLLNKEVPHGVAVAVEKMKDRQNKEGQTVLDIDATVYCERDTHKGIIIGKNGAMLKKIGTYAREDMEKFWECKVNLKIWIKVKEDWRNRENLLRSFGYDNDDFNG